MERTYSGDHLLRSTGGAASTEVDSKEAARLVTTTARARALPVFNRVILESSRFSHSHASGMRFSVPTARTPAFGVCIRAADLYANRWKVTCQCERIIHRLTNFMRNARTEPRGAARARRDNH